MEGFQGRKLPITRLQMLQKVVSLSAKDVWKQIFLLTNTPVTVLKKNQVCHMLCSPVNVHYLQIQSFLDHYIVYSGAAACRELTPAQTHTRTHTHTYIYIRFYFNQSELFMSLIMTAVSEQSRLEFWLVMYRFLS